VFSNDVTGLGVHLQDWKYPLVVDLQTGKAKMDNYGGTWGEPAELDRFQQRYALEAAKQAADDAGQSYSVEYVDAQGRTCIDIQEDARQHVMVGGESGSDQPSFAL